MGFSPPPSRRVSDSSSVLAREALVRQAIAMRIYTIFLLTVFLVTGVAGQNENGRARFVYPSGSTVTYNTLDTVMVTYISTYDSADLYTWCMIDKPGSARLIYQQKSPGFNATVPVLLNFTSATPCWFNLRNAADPADGVNSGGFNIIGVERSEGRRTWGPSDLSETSSSLPTSSTSSISSTASAAQAPATTTVSTDNSNGGSSNLPNASESASSGGGGGLSSGAAAGIGVGAAIGVIALAGGAILLWRRQRRRGGSAPPHPSSYGGGADTAAQMGQYRDVPSAPKSVYCGELNAVNSPVEIATSGTGAAGWMGRAHHELPA
ncbi:hypothetical protein VTK56DRAFT_6454 [Thermocarpiscus australiensis]